MSLEVENLNLEPLFKHFKDIFASKDNLKNMKMLQREKNLPPLFPEMSLTLTVTGLRSFFQKCFPS